MIFSIPFLAAFVLPFLERLLYRPRDVASIRVLVITPTRELAQQIHVVLEKLAQVKTYCFCGCVRNGFDLQTICRFFILSIDSLLVLNIAFSFYVTSQYTDVTSILICGGKKDVRSQEASLRQRPDVVVSGFFLLLLFMRSFFKLILSKLCNVHCKS